MNVILNTPITVTLTSGFLISEGDGVGTIQFRIEEQSVTLAITSSEYVYDTIFQIGDRVRLTEPFGAFEINSEGTLQEIIIDSTEDKGNVYFNYIIPDQTFNGQNTINVELADLSVLFTVPLRILEKV